MKRASPGCAAAPPERCFSIPEREKTENENSKELGEIKAAQLICRYDRMDEGTETLLRELGITDYWITQMKQTLYLPPKAKLIERLLDDMELAWYQLREDCSVEMTSAHL